MFLKILLLRLPNICLYFQIKNYRHIYGDLIIDIKAKCPRNTYPYWSSRTILGKVVQLYWGGGILEKLMYEQPILNAPSVCTTHTLATQWLHLWYQIEQHRLCGRYNKTKKQKNCISTDLLNPDQWNKIC